ncbi:MAG: phosphate/phosphite/phosphonate ABC transporter substrate-binding protein [Candidatus Methylomirabilales bacterium]
MKKNLSLLSFLLFVTFLATDSSTADEPLRIGITGVLVEHNRSLNEEMMIYIGRKLGRTTVIVHRKSYQEMSDLLERGLVDAAFVCGLPYVIDREKFGEELLVAPIFNGKPLYQSYVIVPKDSPARSLEDLRGKLYAFSDPLSNSGKLAPTYRLATMGETPETYFRRYIFTYSHSANVEAVAVKLVDGASVDSYIWEYLNVVRPALTAQTRVVARSPYYGMTPVVVRPDLDPAQKRKLRQAFLNMHQDREGGEILKKLMIDRFEEVPDSHYDSIRRMRRFVEAFNAKKKRTSPVAQRPRKP